MTYFLPETHREGIGGAPLYSFCCLVDKSCLTRSPRPEFWSGGAISFSRGSPWSRDYQTHLSCIAGRFFTVDPPGKPLYSLNLPLTSYLLIPHHRLLTTKPCHPPFSSELVTSLARYGLPHLLFQPPWEATWYRESSTGLEGSEIQPCREDSGKLFNLSEPRFPHL